MTIRLPFAGLTLAVGVALGGPALAYGPSTNAGGGTVTSVACGFGMTGGTITAAGTCAVDPTVVAPLASPNFTGTPVFPANVLTLDEMAQAPPNSWRGRAVGGTGNVSDNTWPACSTVNRFLQYSNGSGLGCVAISTLSTTQGGTGSSMAPTSAQIPVADDQSIYAAKTLSGDCTISKSGALTCLTLNAVSPGGLFSVAPGAGVAALLAGAASGSGGPAGTTSPTLVTPNLGMPSALDLTNATGLPASGITSGVIAAARLPAIVNAWVFGGNIAMGVISSTSAQMAGLGAAANPSIITPTHTGRVSFTLTGTFLVQTANASCNFQVAWIPVSSGIPANGAAAVGNTVGKTISPRDITTNGSTPFSIAADITGLTVGVAYVVDLQMSESTAGDTCQLGPSNFQLHEG